MKKHLIITICIFVSFCLLITVVACDGKSFTISYSTDGNGSIEGISVQNIKSGSSGKKVVAVANEGYQFVSWSDGSLSKERIDQVSDSDLMLCATFKKIDINIKYQAYGGGSIQGETEQSIAYGEDAKPVTAIPDIGYNFVHWSDGVTTFSRQDLKLKADIEINAIFTTKIEYYVAFSANSGGVIEGEIKQRVERGKDSLYVTAVPDENFEFLEWSDGEKNATRNIKNVQSYTKVTATFKRIKQNFSYVYNGATSNANIENATISFKEGIFPKFAIPQREGYTFKGWFLEWHLTTIVSDSQGTLLIGEELFDKNSDSLYAKWDAQENVPHYKILMVNITSIEGNFETYDGQFIEVDYHQTEIERMVHQQTSKFLSNYLNAMMNGAVVFEVYTYDTTITLYEKNFYKSYSTNFFEYAIMGDQIREIASLIDDFDSVITTINFNDYAQKLHHSGGGARSNGKFAYVYAEVILGGYLTNGYTLEYMLDATRNDYESGWTDHMDFYIHEFIHTIELQKEGIFDYHEAVRIYSEEVGGIRTEMKVAELYLTNKLLINGKFVGIPFEFWKKNYIL